MFISFSFFIDGLLSRMMSRKAKLSVNDQQKQCSVQRLHTIHTGYLIEAINRTEALLQWERNKYR